MTYVGSSALPARITRLLLTFILLCLSACADDVQEANVLTEEKAAPEKQDYMVAINRPDNLHLIDLAANEIIRTCPLPGYATPGTVVMSPDRQVAYVLANRYAEVYGVDIDSCEIIFSTRQNHDNIRVITYGSIAVSPDGKEIYTHQNPTRLLQDHYEVLDTRVAVFNAEAGLNAAPVRTFPAPRQVTIMSTDAAGTLYLAGPDMFAMDVRTGALSTVIASLNHDDPRYSPRDALTIWPIGTVSNEFIRLYTVARFTDDSADMETADWFWGYERIDLQTGAAESREFAPLETGLFSGMHRPSHPDQIYAAFNQLKRFDVASMQETGSVDLDHSYYLLNFSPDGATVYLSGAQDDIAVYDAETLQKRTNIVLPGGDMALSTTVVFSR
jgi:quinohemoprotein amine dehydrogenase beta subunit